MIHRDHLTGVELANILYSLQLITHCFLFCFCMKRHTNKTQDDVNDDEEKIKKI